MDQGFRDRYSEAYGNYQGGYGPRGGYPGHGQFGPPPLLGLPIRGPRPMRPPGMMHPGGPGFFGPPVGFRPMRPMRPQNPAKFLQKCGVNPAEIKNLPREVLRLYLPNHCGVCKMDFDTFAFARMHYMSKNHQKNQRKWLLDTPGANTNESPLKARELYCELCDVQITSKPHADSHYAGKSHRAIVEGRKPPKNAKLIMSGTKSRLDKLMKREQKFYKMEQAAAAAAAPDKPKEAPKSSEFYCDICKSIMSCSEQMTAHLNGKRHLAKEKQHILGMMKQGADGAKGEKNGNENDGAENGGEDGAEDVAKDGAENGAEGGEATEEGVEAGGEGVEGAGGTEDDSWVHGTGEGWEDTAQTGA